MLTNGFKLLTGAGGWYPNSWIHTHGDEKMGTANAQYRTVYKPYPIST